MPRRRKAPKDATTGATPDPKTTPPARTAGARARGRYNRAATHTPPARRRTKGGRFEGVGGGTWCVPEDDARAGGFRFSDTAETPVQAAALQNILIEHIRRTAIGLFRDLTPEMVGRAIGLSAPTTRARMADPGSKISGDLARGEARLAAEVLSAMSTGRIAGPLNVRATQNSRWLFEVIAHSDLLKLAAEIEAGIDLQTLFFAFRRDYLIARRFSEARR